MGTRRLRILSLMLAFFALPISGAEPAQPQAPARQPDAASLEEEYLAIGPWRIDMVLEQALGHFTKVEALDGDTLYRAIAQAHFARELPAELTFSNGKLLGVKLRLYEGPDFEAAIQRMMVALNYMEEHFGGSNFEGGLKTSMDPKGGLHGQALRSSIDSLDKGIEEIEAKEKKRKKKTDGSTAYEMVMNFWTELEAPGNFLLGEFRFRSDTKIYSINLYEDREFVKTRVPEASVMLFRVAEPK